jgi:hypothetical protein
MKSQVFFARLNNNESETSVLPKIISLFKSAAIARIISKNAYVALKLHLGEKGGSGYINPRFVRQVVDLVKEAGGKPFLTDTNTLYVGQRSNAVDHLMLAAEHGFSIESMGAPVIIGDGLLGENQISIPTESSGRDCPGRGERACSEKDEHAPPKMTHVAGVARAADVIIGLTHVTGHLLTGYGGNLKNIGMGLAGRGGKLAQHSGMIPWINREKCRGCGTCLEWCPSGAMILRPCSANPSSKAKAPHKPRQPGELRNAEMKAVIDVARCYGCGECFALCPYQAIEIKWNEPSTKFQQRMAEYCQAILKGKNAVFFNFALGITQHCDCIVKPDPPMTPDLGILTSLDPVAVDSATIDLINQNTGKDVFKECWPEIDYTVQLKHAQKIGLGSINYSLQIV